jgi:metal-responsive CopG/Arc/MetJ family transcriptional regulator
MKRVALFLTESQIERLKAIADGRKVSELIRQAIEEFLERQAEKRRG